MQKRDLGQSGLRIAPLVLGGNVFGWTIDQATSFSVLDAFVDAGFDCIDTADMYSVWVQGHRGGESETIIGQWLKRRGGRDKVVIATKVGLPMTPDRKGLSRTHILRSVEDSLRRLQTDYVDLYQAHRDDPDTPLDETLEAFTQLLQQGKVRAIGASNYGGRRLEEAQEVAKRRGFPRFETLQPHYNLCERSEYESDLAPLCRREGIGVIPYYSLASGFLSGKYRSEADFTKGPRGTGAKKYFNERGQRILKALDESAERLRATPAQIALAWLLARPSITAPIASATSIAQLNELLGATRLKLDDGAIRLLDRASE